MTFTVKTLESAEADITEIYRWIAARSQDGAWSWHSAMKRRLTSLADDAAGCAAATEAHRVGRPIRETYFKTRHGNRYRIIFTIVDTEVRVLRVRAYGQKLLRANELPSEESEE